MARGERKGATSMQTNEDYDRHTFTEQIIQNGKLYIAYSESIFRVIHGALACKLKIQR